MNTMTDEEIAAHIEKCFEYNPKTGIFTYKISRGPRKEGDRVGTIGTGGYRMIGIGPSGSQRQIGESRIAFFIMEGRWPDVMDHINGIRDDNRYENLRECTTQQNCINTSSRRGSTSRYRGVHLRKECSFKGPVDLWIAGIYYNKKKIHLGRFKKESDAALAYNEASAKYFGAFGKINAIAGE